MASDEVVQKAVERIEALEKWAEDQFPDGLEEIKLRGMACKLTPLQLVDVAGKERGKLESRGFIIELGWEGKSGPGSKQIAIRFNPKSRPASREPTCVFFAIRDSGDEELIAWEKIPHDEVLDDETGPVDYLHRILTRHSRKDDFCWKLFHAYREDLSLASSED